MKEKLNIFDSLEVLNFEKQRTEYPVHYHTTYCISLIQKGVFGENELIVPKGSIVISHPYEVHDNKLIDNIGVSFSTFYVNQDVVNFISPFEHTAFKDKVIENPIIYRQLNELIQFGMTHKHHKNFNLKFYSIFYQSLYQLTRFYGNDASYSVTKSPALLDDVKQHIKMRLNSKIDLLVLAKIVGMSKFKFIRWFKRNVGITPFEYILLKRVVYGKKLIKQGLPLVNVSLDSGFYDQSHFSNYFKKYVGMTPSVYKRSCNMFQDI